MNENKKVGKNPAGGTINDKTSILIFKYREGKQFKSQEFMHSHNSGGVTREHLIDFSFNFDYFSSLPLPSISFPPISQFPLLETSSPFSPSYLLSNEPQFISNKNEMVPLQIGFIASKYII